jgi:hypothetical protein
VSDRLVRFAGDSWQEIEALPQSVRWTVQRAIFHRLEDPVPALADPLPEDDPLPGPMSCAGLLMAADAKWKLAGNRVVSVAGQARYPDSVPCLFLW